MAGPGLVLITRGAFLTWIWVFGVRRTFKEVGVLTKLHLCYLRKHSNKIRSEILNRV